MIRRKAKSDGCSSELPPMMLPKMCLLPPDVRMGARDGIATQSSPHHGCQLWAWPEERWRIHVSRRGQSGYASNFGCISAIFKTAGCLLV